MWKFVFICFCSWYVIPSAYSRYRETLYRISPVKKSVLLGPIMGIGLTQGKEACPLLCRYVDGCCRALALVTDTNEDDVHICEFVYEEPCSGHYIYHNNDNPRCVRGLFGSPPQGVAMQPFDDEMHCVTPIVQIMMRCGAVMEGFQVGYYSGVASPHGQVLPTYDTVFNMYINEYIVKVEGEVLNGTSSDQALTQIKFFTNIGRETDLCGSERGEPFSATGHRLLYISGKESSSFPYLASVNFTFSVCD